MCCEHREPFFLTSDKAGWIADFLRAESVRHQFIVDAFCVMPDHLHFLAMGMAPTSNLLNFAKSFKTENRVPISKATWIEIVAEELYDHILRPGENAQSCSGIYLDGILCERGSARILRSILPGSFTRPGESLETLEIWMPPWKETKDARLKGGPYRDAVRRIFYRSMHNDRNLLC